MKKIFFLLTILLTLQVSAQRVTVDNVPDVVAAAFKAKFSIAEKVSWAIDDDSYQADFKVGKVDFTGTFDRSGKWLMTEKFIKPSELPKKVKAALIKEFGQLSGFTYDEVEKVETEKGVDYEMDIKKGELTYRMAVSEKGEVIKKEDKTENKKEVEGK